MPRWIQKHLFSLIFGFIGAIFLLVCLVILGFGFLSNRQIDAVESLPLLNSTQLGRAESGVKAVIEGKVSERNPLHAKGYVAYVRSRYLGERCTTDSRNDDEEVCDELWIEDESVKPELWLDLSDGRIRLANTDYEMQSVPVTRQTTETLIAEQTLRYEGFRIDNSVFVTGAVAEPGPEAPAFNATLIYGGDRAVYLAAQREGAGVLFFLGLVFSLFGVVFVTVAMVAMLKFGM
jgi:hypothetical protein